MLCSQLGNLLLCVECVEFWFWETFMTIFFGAYVFMECPSNLWRNVFGYARKLVAYSVAVATEIFRK